MQEAEDAENYTKVEIKGSVKEGAQKIEKDERDMIRRSPTQLNNSHAYQVDGDNARQL